MSTTTFPHADFCLPRPGQDEPRMESYRQTRYSADGLTPAGSIQVERCLECGSATYDGHHREG